MSHSARTINALARQLHARRYLEIGVHRGDTFRSVEIAERTGVDPNFMFDTSEITNDLGRCYPVESDAFFAEEPQSSLYDVAFIDGLHQFEQVMRDFANVMLHTHRRSAMLIDDTLPSDVYSALPEQAAALRHRKAAGVEGGNWHGDVFKIIFYIHDFWPGLNYRTIRGPGNPQTLVWRADGIRRTPLFNSLERISRLTYFDLQNHMKILQTTTAEEAIALCVAETAIA